VPPELEGPLAAMEEMAEAPHRQPKIGPDDCLHVPIFLHQMAGSRRTPVFRSPRLQPGQSYTAIFTQPGVYTYYCEIHGIGMSGTVRVVTGGPPTASVSIIDNQFVPNDITVGTMGPMMMGGGMVTWTDNGLSEHTVTERGGDSMPSFCLNGRSFVGNTPTIEAKTGQKIRWYVFNLDMSMGWHNFHTHGQRWRFASETIDVRSIGPAESFVVETTAPPVLLLPPSIEKHQHQQGHRHGAHAYHVRGDFLFHCHVEMHMMAGLAGVVRAQQTLWLTAAEKQQIEQTTGLPLDPGDNKCCDVDLDHCEKAVGGEWQPVPGTSEITMMHAVLLPNTTKMLYWGYGPRTDQSRIWDEATGVYSQPANQPQVITADENIWSGSQAYLDDANGTILEAGGLISSPDTERRAFLFDPPTLLWSAATDMHQARFYPTTLSMADGKPLTLFGQDESAGVTSDGLEIFTPGGAGTWSLPASTGFNYFYYPWTFLLPGGDLFIAGPQKPSRRFDPAAAPIAASAQWDQVFSQRGVNMEGTAVLLPLRPPSYEPRVLICGGSPLDAQDSSEWIDLSQPMPAWLDAGPLNVPRSRLNSVLLPDGRVMIVGGATDARPDGGPVEIFDPDDPGAGWIAGPTMVHRRDYHSAAILLPDGSVLVGGDPDSGEHERYYPSYFFRPRPTITNAPALVAHGTVFTVQSPQASSIAEVVLMRPGAVTHAFNANQRSVACTFTRSIGNLSVTAPTSASVAPRGWYLLFIVDSDRGPSRGRWIRLSP
jgi:plastocyanin